MSYTLSKLGLMAFYAATAASFFITLPVVSVEVVYWMRWAVVALLGVHLLELVLYHRKVALYQGPMVVSALLTLLFGYLHWLPLSKAQR